jgi:hypothetical protein
MNNDKNRTLYRIIAVVSLFIIAITVSYGIIASIIQGVEVVGQTFVEVEFPPIHIFPFFYAKPISWLFLAIVLQVFSVLELYKEKFTQISEFKINLLKVTLFIIISLSLYEVLFNFTLWSGLMSADALLGKLNPDIIINPFPNPEIPWNIVFATKLYLSALITSGYFFYFLSKIVRKENSSS